MEIWYTWILRQSLSKAAAVKDVLLQLSACFVAGALLLACDRREQAKKPGVVSTSTRAAAGSDASTTAPASRPSLSVLQVDNRLVEFPRARLVLQQTEPAVSLLLFSDDPPDAMNPNYMGNRYYFEIELDITDPAELSNREWVFRAGSMERIDSPNGIFLEGDRKHLQSYMVNMQFDRRGDEVAIVIEGQFTQYSGRDEAPPKGVQVRGMLVAELEKRGQKQAKVRPAK